jgi:dihydroorotase
MKLRLLLTVLVAALLTFAAHGQQPPKDVVPPGSPDYDLLLKGGHVIDAKNNIDDLDDVAIKDGKIVAVAKNISTDFALKTVDVTGMYVTPGLIDLHTHVYAGTGERGSYAGDLSVYPDGFTIRNGVTTIVDAGSSGWRNFPDFKNRIIDRSETRVLAMLNIVGSGMRGGRFENNIDDMDGKATAAIALKYPGVIVGIKSAHFMGPEWKPYEQAVIAGNIAHIPVMIDFGGRRIERPLYQLLTQYLRPGDIYTHAFSGERGEQDFKTGGPSKAMIEGRARGIYFDVGHGQASFAWFTAIPLYNAGFHPDSISTDLHIDSMNAGMKDILNVGDKYLAIGMPLQEVVRDMTWNPAKEILQTQLGNLSVGAIADVAVISIQHGHFGFDDAYSTVLHGTEKMQCELTVKDGKVVYDLNAITGDAWDAPPGRSIRYAARWSKLRERSFGASHWRPLPGQPLIKDWTPYAWTAEDEEKVGKPAPANAPVNPTGTTR